MSNLRTNFDEYLRTFFDGEIYFLASPDLQRETWQNAQGEQFAIRLLISFESWTVIKNNRNKFKLSVHQFAQTEKLFEMLETFQAAHDYPINPRQYASLLTNPEWKKIQKYAMEIYNSISSSIV